MSLDCHGICWKWNASKHNSKNEEIKRENLQKRIEKKINSWNCKWNEIHSQSKHHSRLILIVD
jgi:hypothetical protein